MSIAEYATAATEAPVPKLGMLRSLLLSRSGAHYALADQAVASIGNFATTIIVARNLPVDRYGAFGMLMEVFLFLNGVQAALVNYPLSVRGAVLDAGELRRFATGALTLATLLALPLSMGMAGTAVFVGGAGLALIVAFAMILAQLQETMRRTLMAHLRFADAVPGDAISYLLQAALLYVVARQHQLTLSKTFIIMGATSALAALVQAVQIGYRAFPLHELRALAADYWKRGQWILYASLTTLAASLSYNWTLVLSHGLAEVGRFQVLAAMVKIVNPITSALAGAMLPAVARVYADPAPGKMRRTIVKYAGLAACLLVPYFIFIELFPGFCIRVLFGARPEYLELTRLVRIFMCTYMVGSAVSFTLSYLNGIGESRVNFYGWAANGIISLVIALPMIVYFGLTGVILGGMLGCFGLAAVAAWFAIRHYRMQGRPAPEKALVPDISVAAIAVSPEGP